jgi:predicted nucleotidyltransferase
MLNFESYKQMIVPVLQRYAVKQAAIFGSLAKGNLTEESDIDLLIEPAPGFTLFQMLQMEEDITRLTKRKTDIVEYIALKSSIKDEVEQTAIIIL